MSDLWCVFTEKLKAAGYTLDDLTGNDSLFQLVAEEICNFTPQQVGELQKEWRLYKIRKADVGRGGVARLSSAVEVMRHSPSADVPTASLSAFNVYPTAVVLSRASIFLSNMSEGGAQMLPSTVKEIPATRKIVQAFRERLATLHRPTGGVELMWKLCSPKTLANIKEGRLFEMADDRDALCSSGIVLYRDNGIAVHTLEDRPAELIRRGWCLVAFDAAVGKSRRLGEDEVRLLQHFPIEECFKSLNNDGYDSIRVASCGAFVFFHFHQFVPRFIVTIEGCDARQLNYSNVTDGTDSSRTSKTQKLQRQDDPKKDFGRVREEANRQRGAIGSPQKPSTNFNHDLIVNCPKHLGKEVEFWCPDEKKLLCSHCLFYEGYTKENCMLLADAVQHEAQRLEMWVQNAVTFTNEVGTVTELFRSAERDIERCEQERIEELREEFKRIHAKLNTLEGELLAQVEGRSARQRQTLENCFGDVKATVEKVKELIGDAQGPLSKYRQGVIDQESAAAFLRVTQSAFGEWRAVPIPIYTVVSGWGRNLFKELENALGPVSAIESAGQVELPEAIDVNYLKN
ncbi:hypothetical protein DQ04_10561020 [Trypanosoma grayi]|uniref:hypothetical protein n=1 Tax=Trypanosoma grayi TaxID=71804 RepID=UPI0004F49773|nr:hypothetical protein DQ04_10561020 [Trypanosoma grayi]KEG07208.1 hypothetical protein DQ04_10561020 [Trypanosoma grayi]